MHTKIWWSYVHIRYLVHVQKWTYLALGWPYGWALNFNVQYIFNVNIRRRGPRRKIVTTMRSRARLSLKRSYIVKPLIYQE